MYSLYEALLTQHARQLTPVRCAHSTIAQLHRYFEDVVLENNLSALVIESLPLAGKRPAREKARVRDLAGGGRRTFFFVRQADAINEFVSGAGPKDALSSVILQLADSNRVNEHFVVIADARFSALLATVRGRTNDGSGGDEVVWTFEPDTVYSALEYLMARVSAEHQYQAAAFGSAVRTSMPKATSLQLTLSVTTKLAHLLQEQAGREIAINRIATSIRESLELGVILQKTVDEVRVALNVASCALRVEGQTAEQALSYFYFAGEPAAEPAQKEKVIRDLDLQSASLAKHPELLTQDGCEDSDANNERFPMAIVPLIFHERFMGALQVTAADQSRAWEENELLLLRTVADQVAVAVNHANLFAQIQQQALTDALTGCYNRRSFEMQLDKDLLMAKRSQHPLSLVMLDLDKFKQLNDSAGHDAGDAALRKLADCFRQELRGVDSAARLGGDEFVLILPQAYAEGALIVAERLRARIEQIEIPQFGNLSASMGIAAFPEHTTSRAELVLAADAALYNAKRAGRNRVCVAEHSLGNLDQSSAPIPRAHDEVAGIAEPSM
ncbi:MAG TPA: diguanylate cyclase [Pyrinomonadaceae bacterium]|nr:diguanylate cyclase [Pyrinomonadaceae bacterium]